MANKEIKELLYKLAPSGFIVSLDLQLTETYTVKLFFANG